MMPLRALMQLPPHRRWYLVTEAVAILVVGRVFAAKQSAPAFDDLPALVLLTILIAAGVAVRVEIGPKMKVGVAMAPIFAAVGLFGAGPALAVTVTGATVALIIRPFGGKWASVFNVAVLALCAALGAWAGEVVTGTPAALDVGDGRALAGLLAAAVVMFLTNSMLVAVAVDLQLRQPILGSWFADQRAKALQTIALFLLGLLAAYVGAGRTWAVLLVALPMAIVALSFHQTARLRKQTWEAIEQLADVVDLRDPYTAQHSKRVEQYAIEICRALKLNASDRELIGRAARVHDVGKLGLSGVIISENRPLTDEEWIEMKRHPEIGAQILSSLGDFRAGTAIVLHHHERWDGKGYPEKLAGEAIPFGARIVAVADTYDAMTTDRPYRKGLTCDAALAEIARCRGTQFDPVVASAFLRARGFLPESQAVPRLRPLPA